MKRRGRVIEIRATGKRRVEFDLDQARQAYESVAAGAAGRVVLVT